MRPRWLDPAILAIYTALIAALLAHHAMWRDEMQAWLIARDAPNLPALFRNLRYEGHPALWYLLLWPLGRISSAPAMMQVLHLTIASASVALVLWRAPLRIWERILFPFGYFFLYEYAVKSRSYALGGLLLFALCALWPRRHVWPIRFALVLALMANVHILFAIVAIAVLLALAVERVCGGPSLPALRAPDGIALVIALGGIALAIATCIPPPDSAYAAGWTFGWNQSRLLILRDALGVVLICRDSPWAAWAAIAILALVALRWRRNPPAATLLFGSITGLLAFFYVKYPGYVWHHGLIFIVLFAANWIDRQNPYSRVPHRDGPRGVMRPGLLLPVALFSAILLCQAVTGADAVVSELRQPLSNGRRTAAFIVSRGWARDPVVMYPDQFGVPVIGYLGIDRAYFPNGNRRGSFTVWDRARRAPPDIERAIAVAVPATSPVTWVVGLGVADRVAPALEAHGFRREATFTGARSGEDYVIYRREPVR